MMRRMGSFGLTMNEEVNGDKIGEADEINMEVYIAKN